MKQDIVLAFLTIILTVLILARVREKYTRTDLDKFYGAFPVSQYNGITRDNLRKYSIQVIINELENDTTNKLSNVNLLVDTLNTGRTSQWAHYSTIDDFDTMLETAYTSGESGLTARDRMVIRAIASPGLDFTINSSLGTITYESEGVPDFATTIINESGKTSKEMLLFCFKTLEKIYQNVSATTVNPFIPEVIDYINSYIPDSFTPKYDRNNSAAFIASLQPPLNAKTTWLVKALTIGPAYIAGLAETKWRLDLDWRPPA